MGFSEPFRTVYRKGPFRVVNIDGPFSADHKNAWFGLYKQDTILRFLLSGGFLSVSLEMPTSSCVFLLQSKVWLSSR